MGGKRGQICYQEINTFQHCLMQWQNNNNNKIPLVTSKRCPHFIVFLFPKMNTTVKIHRAQRIHICSTRHTLDKLDMDNSTQRLNPCGSPTTQRVPVDQMVSKVVQRCPIPCSRCWPVSFSSYRHSKGESQSKRRFSSSCQLTDSSWCTPSWLHKVLLLRHWKLDQAFSF